MAPNSLVQAICGEDDFEPTAAVSGFAEARNNQRLVLLPSLQPPPQVPIHREGELSAEIIAEHYSYDPPPDIAVYSVQGLKLFGGGVLHGPSGFFYRSDVLPAYFRPYFEPGGAPLPDIWSGVLSSDDPVVRSFDTACFLPLHPNLVYGHFLLEMLPKLYLRQLLSALGKPLPVLLPSHVPHWTHEFVRCFVSERDLVFYDPRTECAIAPAFVLGSMMHRDHNFHPAFNLVVDQLVGRARAALGLSTAIREQGSKRLRLYVSRKRVATGWHAMENENEVEAVFTDLGFDVIHPQELSLDEQVFAFDSADIVAGEYSSALHNTLFCRPGTKVIALNRINWYQSRISQLRHHRIAYIPPDDGVWRDWRARGGQAGFRMNCQLIRRISLEMLDAGWDDPGTCPIP